MRDDCYDSLIGTDEQVDLLQTDSDDPRLDKFIEKYDMGWLCYSDLEEQQKSIHKICCNNCMKLFRDDEDLAKMSNAGMNLWVALTTKLMST